MMIRALSPHSDRAAVARLFDAIADYVHIERDAAPDAQAVEEFFTDAPPGCDPALSHRLGLFDAGELIALAEMAMGYPEADDAYIGFLAVAATARGKGAGAHLLGHLEARARAAGAHRLYLAVLDANPRGRAFWEREGFAPTGFSRDVTLGAKTQLAHRLVKGL